MEQNDGLSPEELAAIEGEDETQTDDLLEAVAENNPKGDDDAPDEEAPAEAVPEEAAAAVKEEQEGDDPEKGPGPVEEPEAQAKKDGDEVEPAGMPLDTGEIGEIKVPDNIPHVRFQFRDDGQVLPEYKERFSELDDKYEAGYLPLGDYNEQRDALKAEMANIKANAQLWQAECEAFWAHNKDWQPGTPLFDMLNGEVRRLAASEQASGLSGIELIYAAQERVSHAIAALNPPAGQPKPNSGKPAESKASHRPASPKPPDTTHALGTVPPAAPAEVGRGEFAHLETLEGLEL